MAALLDFNRHGTAERSFFMDGNVRAGPGLITGFVLTLLIFWPPKPVRTRVYDPSTGAVYESQLES